MTHVLGKSAGFLALGAFVGLMAFVGSSAEAASWRDGRLIQADNVKDFHTKPSFFPFNRDAKRPAVQQAGGAVAYKKAALQRVREGVPQDISLLTQSGLVLGGHVGAYRYQENVVSDEVEFMHLSGYRGGVDFQATQAFDYDMFLTADVRFTYGENDYDSAGTGSGNDKEDYVWELRALFGKDFVIGDRAGVEGGDMTIALYSGIGYRNLFNDALGLTSTGAVGYRRMSEYLYLPVGFTPRFRLDARSRLSLNGEFDWLIRGKQTSYLSDVTAYPTIENTQYSGYGVKGSLMYERDNWSVGPYVEYWNIPKSGDETGWVGGVPVIVGNEPHNYTLEYGVKAAYRFDWAPLTRALLLQ